MYKKIWIFLIILILCLSLSDAIKTITVSETELVSLKPQARDEDDDKLSYSFSEPLDENGQWQTDYGDKGEYKITVTVSDGESETSQDVLLVVKKKNIGPTIDSFFPEEIELTISEWDELEFSVEASDLNKDELKFTWKVDNLVVGNEENYKYKAKEGDAGRHRISIVISDGETEDDFEWIIIVKKFDRSLLLEQIKSATVNENEVMSLELPDFEKYDLEYTLSDPLGDDNKWETTYTDEGKYAVEVTIKDGEFSISKTIDVTVVDIDRPFVFKPIANAIMKENQKINIELEADDPDDDPIEFSSDTLPAGASLKGNKFEWIPSYDTVNKEKSYQKALDKFHILYMPFKIVFIAKSKGVEQIQSMLITVKDVNRKPILKEMDEIVVNEGETIVLEPEAIDEDGDNIVYSYSGWMDANNYTTNYEDAGTYKVKIKAFDGFLSDEKYVTVVVEDTNRAPVFGEVGKIEVYENEKLEFALYADDPDGDSVNISAELLPDNSYIENNVFIWEPGYFTVTNGSTGTFSIDFIASDGEYDVIKSVNVTVYNVNRAPKITEAGPKKSITVKQGSKQKFKIVAEDADGEDLTYIWKFSLLEQYKGHPLMERKFTSVGDKKITVVVSDGEDEDEYTWKVKVI